MLKFTATAGKVAAFVDGWHWLLIILATPFLLFPSTTSSLVLLIVPIVWVAAWITRSEFLPRTPLNVILLVLCLTVLVSAYATYDITISLPKISGMVLAMGVFYAIVREGRHQTGWWLSFIVFWGIGLAITGFSLFSTQWINKIQFLIPITFQLPARITGLSGAEAGLHPNQVAGTLLWIMPVSLALTILLLLKVKDLWAVLGYGRTLAIVSLMTIHTILLTGVFLLTQSRSGYIALFVTGVVLVSFILILLPSERRKRLYILAGVSFSTIIIVGVVFFGQGYGNIFEKSGNLDFISDPAFSLDTLQGRLEIWSRAIYGIQDFPFTGMGMNTFRHIVHVFYPLILIGPDFDIGHAHNEFLQAALDLGIPGLVAFLALHISAFWMLKESWQMAQKSLIREQQLISQSPVFTTELMTKTIILGFGSGLFAHMIYGLMDAVALGAKPGVLFWIFLGLISGLFTQVNAGQQIEWPYVSSFSTGTEFVTSS